MADTVLMPKLGFDMSEGTLVRWLKSEGDSVHKGEVLAEIETDKATVEVESNFSGIVTARLVEKGAVVPVGQPIAIVAAPGEKAGGLASREIPPATTIPLASKVPSEKPASSLPAESPPGLQDDFVKASPLAKRLARDKQIDLSTVKGSGPGGRIVRRDVESQVFVSPGLEKAMSSKYPMVGSISQSFKATSDRHLPVEKLRAAIGRRLVESKQQLPHFYISRDFDVELLSELRREYNSMAPKDQKLSINDLLVRAVAIALKQFPNLNASLTGNEIVQHGAINIGVAVSVPGGLLTVVCRNADQKSIQAISSELKERVIRARVGKVKPEDIEGSTFSISNLGMYEVDEFIAIINMPETAILAIGAVRETPVIKDHQVAAGMRMKATLSADHRITDGAEGARFMQALAGFLEKPLSIFL